MTKTVTHIEVPKEWESSNDWDSHRPLLYLACEKTEQMDGPRVEFGCGYGSSELMDTFYKGKGQLKGNTLYGKHFFSFETNREWADRFPNTFFYPDYSLGIMYADKSVFSFVDCAPAELRKDIINSIANSAYVIIVHDTEPGADYVYKLSDILSHNFKYRLNYAPEGKPHTTAVSNFIDVTKWVE